MLSSIFAPFKRAALSRWCSLMWLNTGAYKSEEEEDAGESEEDKEGRRV